jgi:hypothetical protein
VCLYVSIELSTRSLILQLKIRNLKANKVKMWQLTMKKIKLLSISLIIFLLGVFFLVPHARLAFKIATGIGLTSLQKQIEATQSRAIKGDITEDDKEFLVRLYRTMAYGTQASRPGRFFAFCCKHSCNLSLE